MKRILFLLFVLISSAAHAQWTDLQLYNKIDGLGNYNIAYMKSLLDSLNKSKMNVNLIPGFQPLDGDLTAIGNLSGTGFAKRTGTNTWSLDGTSYGTINTLGEKALSGLVTAPGSGQNGYSLTWDNSNNRYTLTNVSGGGGGSGPWGTIPGTLSDQTDLQSALDAKVNLASVGTVTPDASDIVSTGDSFATFTGTTAGNLQAIMGTFSQPVITGLNNKITVDGNSQAKAIGTVTLNEAYPQVARDILGSSGAGYSFVNIAYSGQTSPQMYINRASVGTNFDASKDNNYLWAWEIENDAITETDPTNLYNNIANYYSYLKGLGFKVIGATSPRQLSDPVKNKARADASALLRATTTSYDYLVDMDLIPWLTNTRSSVGFQSDNIHFNKSGMKALADAYVSKVRQDLSQTDYTPPSFASWYGNTTDRSMVLGTKSGSNFPLGFITNGKIHAEFTTDGTFVHNSDLTAVSGKAYGLYLNSGFTFTANGDKASLLTLSPSYYYNPSGYTATQSAVLRTENESALQTYVIFNNGKHQYSGKYTATSGTESHIIHDAITTGYSSGTFTHDERRPTHNFAANSTIYEGINFKPVTNEGAFTGTQSKIVTITNVTPTALDRALTISTTAGYGIDLPNHAGNAPAINVVSTTSFAGALNISSSNEAALYTRSTGTTAAVWTRQTSTSNLSGLVTMNRYDRTPGSSVIANNAGMSFEHQMNRSNGTPTSAAINDIVWKDNTTGAEITDQIWKNRVAGTMTEGMRLSGKSLGVGNVAPTSQLQVKGNGTTTGSTFLLEASDGTDRLEVLDNGSTTLNGTLSIITAGNGIKVPEGSNATMGVATLSSGTVTVNTTKVTANSRIFLTINGGSLTNVGATYISARSAGTSFTISSTNASDASQVAWIIIEPN